MKRTIQLVILIALIGAIIYLAVPDECGSSGKTEPRVVCIFNNLGNTADEKMDRVTDRMVEGARLSSSSQPDRTDR